MYLLNQHTEDALDRVFEGFFSSANNGLTRNYKTETNDDNYIVEMALPGYDKKDIKLSTKDNSLTIESSEHDEWKRSFSKSFQFPSDVDTSKISAEMKNGILTITLNKAEQTKTKTINIK